jgi:Tol biopolymer transport system component
MRKHQRSWSVLILLSLCAFAVQGCFSIGSSGGHSSGSVNSTTVNVVQHVFSGKIYVTIRHNLFVIAGDGSSKKLLDGGNIYDPAVSPDGSQLALVRRFQNYSDLDLMLTSGGNVRILISGNGGLKEGYFFNASGYVHSRAFWFFKPSWSPDGSKLLFLSDHLKQDYAIQYHPYQDADMLDLMVFSMPLNNPSKITALAYTSFGGGGDSDPGYNPADANQIVYTHYGALPGDGSQQQVQLMLADARLIAANPGKYYAASLDTGIAITAPKYQSIQPAYSPDGRFLAYIRNESITNTAISVMAVAPGVTATPNDPVTEQKALLPSQQSVKLLEGIYDARPTWSPNGQQIAYLSEQNEELDIWIINLNYNGTTGIYRVQGSPVQATSSGIDGDSRFSWSR